MQRNHIRFKPDPHEFARIDPSSDFQQAFEFKYAGLIIDEATYGGCSFLTYDTLELQKGSLIRVQLSELSPLIGEVVWAKKDSEGFIRYGVKFLE